MIRERDSWRSSHCTPTAVVAFHEPLAGVYVWIALPFQFANRLSSLLSVDVPGFVWRASKKRSGGAKISSFWLKKPIPPPPTRDRKSTRLKSSHSQISYAVF